MIHSTGPEESTYADAHAGDLIQLAACPPEGCYHPPGRCPGAWRPALRLLTDPTPCPDHCGASCCTAVDGQGRTVPIHAAPTRQTRVIEHGPSRRTA